MGGIFILETVGTIGIELKIIETTTFRKLGSASVFRYKRGNRAENLSVVPPG
jgi:hypothetical protein